MGYGGFGAGAMGFGAVWMIVFWVLVIAGVALLVRQLFSSPPVGRIEGGPQTPRDILGERYARGEINKEEFERKRRNLDAP
jgi:putative membrane protein